MKASALVLALVLLAPVALAMPSLVRTISPGASAFNGLQIALADFRGDGHIEAVVQSDDGNVYVVDPATGAVLATFAPGNAGCTSSCYAFEGVSGPINAPIVADLDHDGVLDVVLADTAAVVARFRFDPASSDATHFVFVKMWEHRYNQYQSYTTMDASPAVADVDGDGKLDIVVATEETGIFAVRADGSTLWARSLPSGHATPSIGDVDGDGKLEVVMANDAGVVYSLVGATGATKWTFDAGAYVKPASIPMQPTLSDIDGDGKRDILFMARDAHDATNFAADHAMLFAVSGAGKLMWKTQPSWAAPLSHTRPILVSVNGARSILVGDWNTIGHKPGNFEKVGPGHVALFDATGHEKWHKDLNAAVSDKDIAVADVVGDGTQQVIAAGTLNGATGLLLFDLATGASKGFLQTPAPTRSTVAVGDLFGDGKFAMVVAVSGGSLQVWRGTQALRADMPGWGAIGVPKGSSSTTPPPPPPTSNATFDATFGPKGNEYWVETSVKSTHVIASVTASLDGGAPALLPKDSWGTWAKSIHAADGTLVQFVATDDAGATATSGCYRWTAATLVTCAGSPPPPPPPPAGNSTFDATFGPKGNEYWVETSVRSTHVIASVTASLDGASPSALPKDSWGTWAKSIHAADGTLVQFVATDDAGATATSGCYRWTAATLVACPGAVPPSTNDTTSPPGNNTTAPPPPPPTNNTTTPLAATFSPRNGNEWWEQVRVNANEAIQLVEVRVNGGPWTAMKLQSYGDWTASVHAPAGSKVEFRATGASGAQQVSQAFTWPQ